jgi:hypothetical protein
MVLKVFLGLVIPVNAAREEELVRLDVERPMRLDGFPRMVEETFLSVLEEGMPVVRGKLGPSALVSAMFELSKLEVADISSSRLLFRRFHHQNAAQRTMELKMTQTRPRVTDRPIFVDELEVKVACDEVGDEDEEEWDSDLV